MQETKIQKRLSSGKLINRFKSQWELQVVVVLSMIYIFIFCYIPMVGIIIAFKDYKITQGFMGFFTSKWVGLKYYKEFFTDFNFGLLVRNTVVLSFLKVIFSFPAPILFAICINEFRHQKFKKLVQTVSYLPHFISWVVVTGIIFSFLNQQNGVLNQILVLTGIADKPIDFLTNAKYFWPMAIISDIWKETGWWAIIFLAAITGIDHSIYEAATVDGAGRIKRIIHVVLPSIKGSIVVMLILCLGGLLGGGLSGSNFEQSYLLGNKVNYSASEIIQTYTLRIGLAQGRYSYATAIGFLQSIISLVLILSSNFISKKITDRGLF